MLTLFVLMQKLNIYAINKVNLNENSSEMETKSQDSTDFDITDTLNVLLPFEKHLPGMRYCGPGTRLDLRLDENEQPKVGQEPVDRIDQAALRHDLSYKHYPDLKHRNAADKQMIKDLLDIEKPSCRERAERLCVLPILVVKRYIGSFIIWLLRL